MEIKLVEQSESAKMEKATHEKVVESLRREKETEIMKLYEEL